jgi:hypothetical protein
MAQIGEIGIGANWPRNGEASAWVGQPRGKKAQPCRSGGPTMAVASLCCALKAPPWPPRLKIAPLAGDGALTAAQPAEKWWSDLLTSTAPPSRPPSTSLLAMAACCTRQPWSGPTAKLCPLWPPSPNYKAPPSSPNGRTHRDAGTSWSVLFSEARSSSNLSESSQRGSIHSSLSSNQTPWDGSIPSHPT